VPALAVLTEKDSKEAAINTHMKSTEVAPEHAWFKSTYSSGAEGNCVEVADTTAAYGGVGVRDSKDPEGPALLFSPGAFADFLTDVVAGRFDV